MMNGVLQAAWATYLFELKMSLTGRRAITGLVLAAFPPFLCFVIARQINGDVPIGAILSFLVMSVELFALLLWIPAGIYSELEGKNWVFSTSRPAGRTAMLIGKWLSGATWAAMVGTVSLSSTILLLSIFVNLYGMFFPALLVIIFGALAYGAVFSLISVLVLKRAMGVSVAYFLFVECLIGFTPAIVQKATIFYHLRCICFHLMDGQLIGVDQMDYEAVVAMVGLTAVPLWGNMLSLFGISLVFLSLATYLINRRQLIIMQEV